MWTIIGLIVLGVAVAILIAGFVATAKTDDASPLIYFVTTILLIILGTWLLDNSDTAWAVPLIVILRYIAIPIICLIGFLTIISDYWWAAWGDSKNLRFGKSTGSAGTTNKLQKDFLVILFVIAVFFVSFGGGYAWAGLKTVYGVIPPLEGGEVRHAVEIANSIDEMRRENMPDKLLNAQRFPYFRVSFHKEDIQSEAPLYIKLLNTKLATRNKQVTKILGLTFEAPHSSKHKTGYCFVTCCVKDVGAADDTAVMGVFTLAEDMQGSVAQWSMKRIEGKLKGMHEVQVKAVGMTPRAAVQFVEYSLNTVPAGKDVDDLHLVPTGI